MSAGTGIVHSEYNREDVETRIFQIWIIPDRAGNPPSWGARPFPKADRAGSFVTLASGRAGDEAALPIRTDARVVGATVRAGETVSYALEAGRHAYLVPATGRIKVNGAAAKARDGVAIRDVASIEITAVEDSEIVLVDAA
jgi:redox-sensitive bicupin YhaK (pirin superfamily)